MVMLTDTFKLPTLFETTSILKVPVFPFLLILIDSTSWFEEDANLKPISNESSPQVLCICIIHPFSVLF